MTGCCTRALESIQAVGELGSALQLFLGMSPLILIVPDILPPNSAREATETLVEKVSVMAADKVLGKVTEGVKLPDFADSVRNAQEITLGQMNNLAFIHSLKHPKFSTEGQIWNILTDAYDPNGDIRNSGGWDWNPLW